MHVAMAIGRRRTNAIIICCGRRVRDTCEEEVVFRMSSVTEGSGGRAGLVY